MIEALVPIVAIVAVCVILISNAIGMYERSQWNSERAQLLDRLMARNWGEYVAGTRTIEAPETPQLTTDEAEAAWYAAQRQESA